MDCDELQHLLVEATQQTMFLRFLLGNREGLGFFCWNPFPTFENITIFSYDTSTPSAMFVKEQVNSAKKKVKKYVTVAIVG